MTNFPPIDNGRRKLVLSTLLSSTVGMVAPAASQEAYPSRPVKLLVGFAPGGAPDTIAREVAKRLSDLWGQPVVVDNKPGAGGAIAADQAAKAPADGLTLFLTSDSAMVSAPFVQEKISYDPLTDLKPISLVSGFPLVLVANPALKVKNLRELVAAAKARPNQIAYASTGIGTSSHLPMERFQRATGIQLTHVAYKGGPQALLDLMAGQAPLMLNTEAMTAPHIKAGKLVLLSVCSPQRLAQFPDAPTSAEQGFADFEAGNWVGVVGPAGLPETLANKIHADLQKVVGSTGYRDRLAGLGFEVRAGSREAFAEQIKTEYRRNKDLLATLNVPKS